MDFETALKQNNSNNLFKSQVVDLQSDKSTVKSPLSLQQREMISTFEMNGGTLYKKDNKEIDMKTLLSLKNRSIITEKLSETNDVIWELNSYTNNSSKDTNKKAGNTMTTAEFKEICDFVFEGKRGWQKKLSILTGATQNTVSKWVSERLDVPVYATTIIVSLATMKENGVELPFDSLKD